MTDTAARTEAAVKALLEVSREVAGGLYPPETVNAGALTLSISALSLGATRDGARIGDVLSALAAAVAGVSSAAPAPHKVCDAICAAAKDRLVKILAATLQERLKGR